MFGYFKKKKKSDLEIFIETHGIELVAEHFSEIILKKMPTDEIAYQFVLEEIEAASQGDDTAIKFARDSGISPNEYKGSMRNSRPEVDGPDGPQQFLLNICIALNPNMSLVVDLRTKIVDNVMRSLSFGKYEGRESSSLGLTSPFDPIPELQSEAGVRNYISKLSKLSRSDLCVEFSNVRAAKFNLINNPGGISDFQKQQDIVTDLTGKSVAICIVAFGQPAVFDYVGGDLVSFNILINDIDDQIAALNLEPEQHGEQLFKKLGEYIQG